jgi:DNA-binding FadR family transcriptional regulator
MNQGAISGTRRRGARVTDDAIERIREFVASGEWGPGDRLPRETDLAKQLGVSRNSLREAVRALSLARVLEVRQGDGTYVSILEPGELLAPTLSAAPLLGHRAELFEVRRMLEPEAAAMAALGRRRSARQLRTSSIARRRDRADNLVDGRGART